MMLICLIFFYHKHNIYLFYIHNLNDHVLLLMLYIYVIYNVDDIYKNIGHKHNNIICLFYHITHKYFDYHYIIIIYKKYFIH